MSRGPYFLAGLAITWVGCGLTVVGASDGAQGASGADGAAEGSVLGDGGTSSADGEVAPELPIPEDPPAQCGRPSTYVDDFADGTLGAGWGVSAPAGGSVAEIGGRLVITNPAGGGSRVASIFAVNLDEDRIRVEVPIAPSNGTTAVVSARLDATHELAMSVEGTTLRMVLVDGAAPDETILPYDPAAHRWWQIAESGGNVRFETSPDAVTWTTHKTAKAPAFARVVRIVLEARGAASGEAFFDRLNAGRSRAPWCKASTFSDDFEDGVTGRDWMTVTEGACSFKEQSGEVRFTMTGLGISQCAYQTATAYDLRDSAVFLEIPAITSFYAPVHFFLRVTDGAGKGAAIGFVGSNQLISSATGTTATTSAYGGSSDDWWRLRESGGSLFWESSSDGTTWVEERRAAAPFPLDAVRVMLGVQTDAAMGGSISIGTPRFNTK